MNKIQNSVRPLALLAVLFATSSAFAATCSVEDYTANVVGQAPLRSNFEVSATGDESIKDLTLAGGAKLTVGYLSGRPLFGVDVDGKSVLFVRGLPDLELASPHFIIQCR